jgi:hypothetical protein
MFKVTDNRGFSIKFQNGYIVSVQFGPGNYGSNREVSFEKYGSEMPAAGLVETALIDPNGKFVRYQGDDVQGYQDVQDVLELFNYAANLRLDN